MASPRPPVAIPTAEEFLKLVTSRPVKIYVGTKAEPYVVPVDLISYYSPYFAAAFRPNAFKEGIEGVLRLPENKPCFLEAVIEHLRGHTAKLMVKMLPEGPPCEPDLRQCLLFVRFVDKYDICEAASAIVDSLKKILDDPDDSSYYQTSNDMRELLAFAFAHLHADNPVLTVLTNFLASSFSTKNRWREPARDFLDAQKDDVFVRVMREYMKLTAYYNGEGEHLLAEWIEEGDPYCSCHEVK